MTPSRELRRQYLYKKVTLLISEVLAVQLYEKTAATGGSKRPGFSFDS